MARVLGDIVFNNACVFPLTANICCRMINETLYKSHSSEASRMMHEDPQMFEEVCQLSP